MTLRVVVFFSGGASGFRFLSEEDPNYGKKYKVVGGITDSPGCEGEKFLRKEGIEVKSNNIEEFYDGEPLSDLDIRREYDKKTLEIVKEFEPDLILLSGYMWIITEPLTENYRIINVHPADLTIKEKGERVYTGKNPVYDAISRGEKETRSSVHFVTQKVDEGPLLVISHPFSVHTELVDELIERNKNEKLKKYSEAHQEWMKWKGDGPAISKAIEIIADKNVEIDDGKVNINGDSGPFFMKDPDRS